MEVQSSVFEAAYEAMRFLTSANDVIAALPAILAHSHIIEIPAMIMCIIGGLLIYGTIISFSMFFQEEQEF
jgi:Vacuolar protein sorting 55